MEVYGNEAGNPLITKKSPWHSKKVLAGDTCSEHEFDEEDKKIMEDAYGKIIL